jgi:hypothetical protein
VDKKLDVVRPGERVVAKGELHFSICNAGQPPGRCPLLSGPRDTAPGNGHFLAGQDIHIAKLSVPDHPEVAKETLRNLIRASGLTPAKFQLPHHP